MLCDFTHVKDISVMRESQYIDVTPMGSATRQYMQSQRPYDVTGLDMFIDVSTWGHGDGFVQYFENKVLSVQRFDQTFEVGPTARFSMEGILQEGKGYTVMTHERCHLCQAPLVETHEAKKKKTFTAGEDGRPKFNASGDINKPSTSVWRTTNVYTFQCGTTVEYDTEKYEDFGTVVTLGATCLKLKP